MEKFSAKKPTEQKKPIRRRDLLKTLGAAAGAYAIGKIVPAEARHVPLTKDFMYRMPPQESQHETYVRTVVEGLYVQFMSSIQGKLFVDMFPGANEQQYVQTLIADFVVRKTETAGVEGVSAGTAIENAFSGEANYNELGNALIDMLNIREPTDNSDEEIHLHGDRVGAVLDLLNFLFRAKLQIEHE